MNVRRNGLGWVAGGGVALLVLLVATNAIASSGPATRPLATHPTTTTPTTTATTTTPPAAVRVWPADPLAYDDGVLTVDGVRYAVGQPGDAVVAGDWACTGRRTVALLRPPTGEVFAFDEWAGGEEVTGRLVGTVDGSAGLRVVAGGDGCDDLEVTLATGHPVLVDPGPVAAAQGAR